MPNGTFHFEKLIAVSAHNNGNNFKALQAMTPKLATFPKIQLGTLEAS